MWIGLKTTLIVSFEINHSRRQPFAPDMGKIAWEKFDAQNNNRKLCFLQHISAVTVKILVFPLFL